ncbi:MAG: DUF1826 domain-containing protein [Lentisphaeraceae bacterium]|nr:DUF1826 domain-containing protein [Lentisphaeraceae bacterium]
MNVATEIFNPLRFNVTEDISEFNDSNIGAFYIENRKCLKEIEQRTLFEIVRRNHERPIRNYSRINLDFYPEELFLERSFKDLKKAKKFIESFFSHFQCLDLCYCDDILDKLRLFCKLVSSTKSLNCRFEVISGNSCKKFHVDTVSARLISTYAGPGTQVKNPFSNDIITLPSSTTLIVKGSMFENFKPVTLHRSPPISNLPIKRFLFVADYQ